MEKSEKSRLHTIETDAEEMSCSQKTNFSSHFNLDQTKLKMSAEIEHTIIYMRPLQNLSPNVNTNEPSDEEVKLL